MLVTESAAGNLRLFIQSWVYITLIFLFLKPIGHTGWEIFDNFSIFPGAWGRSHSVQFVHTVWTACAWRAKQKLDKSQDAWGLSNVWFCCTRPSSCVLTVHLGLLSTDHLIHVCYLIDLMVGPRAENLEKLDLPSGTERSPPPAWSVSHSPIHPGWD